MEGSAEVEGSRRWGRGDHEVEVRVIGEGGAISESSSEILRLVVHEVQIKGTRRGEYRAYTSLGQTG